MIVTRAQHRRLTNTVHKPLPQAVEDVHKPSPCVVEDVHKPFSVTDWVVKCFQFILDLLVFTAVGVVTVYLIVYHLETVTRANNCAREVSALKADLQAVGDHLASCQKDVEVYNSRQRYQGLLLKGLVASVCLNIVLATLCYIFFQNSVGATRWAVLWASLGVSGLVIAFCMVQ